MKSYGDKIWEQLFSSHVWGKYPSEECIRFFMRAKKALNKEIIKALDIGCGKGACSWFMAKEGAIVTAIDGAPSGLKNVNKLAKEFGVNEEIEIVLGDITKPKRFLNDDYDIMLDHYSIYANYEEQIINTYREFFDVLSDVGFFLTCCFGKNTTGFGTGKQLARNTFTNIEKGIMANRGISTFFSRDELNDIFKEIGYNIQYCENILENRNGILVEKNVTCLKKS